MEGIINAIKASAEDRFPDFARRSSGKDEEDQRNVVGSLTMVATGEQDWVGREFPVYQLPTYLGRASDNDVILPDISVSRSHARIAVFKEKTYLQDLGSRFGTFLNGEKLKSDPVVLSYGDRIRLGYKAILQYTAAEFSLSSEEENRGPAFPATMDDQITMAVERDHPGADQFTDRLDAFGDS
jgi:hypothetical protein